MTQPLFPYPGGKKRYADWIISKMPEHECYVEPFAGAATVLLSKPQSRAEILNDIDDTLICFFEVLRDRPEELIEWLAGTPYSRSLHEKYWSELLNDDRLDPVEKAGRFFYGRHTTYGGTLSSGFKEPKQRNESDRWYDMVNAYREAVVRLEEKTPRLADVVIENLDYRDCLERYDGVETFFYIDSPYSKTADMYGDDFDFDELLAELPDLEGRWLLSNDSDIPSELYEWSESTDALRAINNTAETSTQEWLFANYEPEEVTLLSAESDPLNW